MMKKVLAGVASLLIIAMLFLLIKLQESEMKITLNIVSHSTFDSRMKESQPKTTAQEEKMLLSAAESGDIILVKQLLNGQTELDINAFDEDGKTPLFLAAWNGQDNTVQLLMGNSKCDINRSDNMGWTPLQAASHRGFNSIVEMILKDARTDVNKADHEGFTPFIEASFSGMTEVVKLLLRCRATNIDVKDGIGMTALEYAADRMYTDIINVVKSRKLLIKEHGDTCPVTQKKDSWYTVPFQVFCFFSKRWHHWEFCSINEPHFVVH